MAYSPKWWKGRELVAEKSDKRGRCRHHTCHKPIKAGQDCVVIKNKKDGAVVARFCNHQCQNEHTLSYMEARERAAQRRPAF